MNRSNNNECRIYVGNLPHDVRERDLQYIFSKYGHIADIDLKNRPGSGPPFAFVEFEDRRDAEDAIRGRDGYDLDGHKIRAEFPRGRDRGGGSRGFGGGRGGGFGGRSRGPPPRRSDFQVIVSGMPPTGSWQDLKDHMRKAGDVLFTDVFKDGTGHVEFQHRDDMKRAIRDLDDTEFTSHEGERSYIRVKAADSGRRSRSYSRSRSRSRSPRKSYNRSRSRSQSPRRSRSPRRSYSRSPKRSPSPRRSRSRSRSHSSDRN